MTLTRTNWPDVDDLIALYADDDQPMTPARVLSEEMPRLMAHNRRTDRLGSWVARDSLTACLLGWFMVRPVDQPLQTVELTYRLRPRAVGHGYDVEGIRLMIEMARAAQVTTIVTTIPVVDVASLRLVKQAGGELVQQSVDPLTGPTSSSSPCRNVDYTLDLTLDAELAIAK
jgi:RimJ/RimL family protein N-acetyltransferase